MTQLSFGFILPQLPAGEPSRVAFVDQVQQALHLVSGHFDSFHMVDHLEANDLESFSTLGFFAGQYPQLRFGHTVVCQSLRNPALVAKMGATLFFLSGGRFLLGIGAGWNEPEYRAYGYEFPPASARVTQLDEALRIIKALWVEGKANFAGQYYRVDVDDFQPWPQPVPPIMIGAFKPRMLRLAAQYADEWNVSSTGKRKYARLKVQFDAACAKIGRDPGTVKRSWGGGCICASSRDRALQLAGERYSTDPDEDFDPVGTPDQVSADLQALIDLGVSTFYLDCGGFPDLTTLELLISEVIPALKAANRSEQEPDELTL